MVAVILGTIIAYAALVGPWVVLGLLKARNR